LSQKRREKKKASAKKPKEQPVEAPPKVEEPVSPWATDRMSRPNPRGASCWAATHLPPGNTHGTYAMGKTSIHLTTCLPSHHKTPER
jgi:hypothetical protein